jgi:hypothetical protein
MPGSSGDGDHAMLFILRAVFWLSVAAAIVPARQESDLIGEIGRETATAAVDLCTQNATRCIGGIQQIARLSAAPVAARDPAPAIEDEADAQIARVPLPAARPRG